MSSLLSGFDGRLALALELARAAGDSTLEYFQTDRYAGGTQRRQFAGDGCRQTSGEPGSSTVAGNVSDRCDLGEEFGAQTGTTEFEWIVDPIDGTKSFIGGVPLYSTLLALVHQGQVLAGAIYIPALREMIFAVRGRGAWWSVGDKAQERAQVSTRDLAHGMFVTHAVRFLSQTRSRGGIAGSGESRVCNAHLGRRLRILVGRYGRAEVMVDPIANPWDLASVGIVIEEAGGKFSSWKGSSSYADGDGVGSNGVVHNEVLRF